MADEKKSLIDEKEDRRYMCRYQTTIIIMRDETNITLQPENILLIEKIDNFDFEVRPTLHLKLQIDTRKKLWMMKNKKDLKCKFELNTVTQDPDPEKVISGGAIVWSSMFNIYFNESDINTDLAATEQTTGVNEDNQTPMNDLENESFWERSIVDLFLVESKSLACSKKKVNRVFTSENFQNMICVLCNDVGQNNVYMTRLDNQQTYSNFCVPEYPFITAIEYLDSYYGFYTCGAQIYYDIDKLYILKANGKNTAKKKDEWVDTVFLITGKNLAMPGNGMIKKPEEKVYYINITEENLIPYDQSLVTSVNQGSVAKVISSDSGDSKTVTGGTDSVGEVQFIKFYRSNENKYIPSMIQARMEENTCIEKITVDNADLRAFALNKTIKLVFEEPEKQKRYSKNRYRLAYASHVLRAESDQYMVCTSRLVLKKCSDA